jgi:hypothetical protein
MSRDELITLVAERDARIAAMAGQLSELIEAKTTWGPPRSS